MKQPKSPKFNFNDKVYVVVENDGELRKVECVECDNGAIVGKTGKNLDCPICYGTGFTESFGEYYDVIGPFSPIEIRTYSDSSATYVFDELALGFDPSEDPIEEKDIFTTKEAADMERAKKNEKEIKAISERHAQNS